MQKHGLDPQLFRTDADPLTAASDSGDKKTSGESST
jgi:hypothetical protein